MGEKIVTKVAAVLAVSGSVFVLTATSVTVSSVSTVALAESQASAPVCGPPSMANCTPETMQNYLNYVRPMVEKFFSGKYNGTMQGSPNYHFIDKGGKVQSDCRRDNGGPPADDKASEYCSAGDGIYLGQAYMWDSYQNYGNIVPAVALAHEWGHHIQFVAGVQEPKVDDTPGNVKYENQADCVAGAWIQYAYRQGWFGGRGDGSVERMIDGISENDGRNRDHGTPRERAEATSRGFNYGLGACNEYNSEHHIVPG